MKKLDSNILCPSCSEKLKPRILVCEDCDVRVEGQFELNEFATLSPDDLHFLRIFVRAEGKVREMEAALGLSYPTIRSKLGALKTKLDASHERSSTRKHAHEKTANDETLHKEILDRLSKGEITFDEALDQIKKTKGESS